MRAHVKKYSTEARDLLQLFMDLAVRVKNLHSYQDGYLVIDGFVGSGSTNVYWQFKDGTKKPL